MSVEPIADYIEPVRKFVEVTKTPAEAFDIFTLEISSWWPKERHSISQERTDKVVLEPKQGGLLYEVRSDGKQFAWGKVLTWERPNRLVLTWHPGREPKSSQEVELRFEPTSTGTRVDLEHRGWQRLDSRAQEARDDYNGGWNFVFGECFLKACAS